MTLHVSMAADRGFVIPLAVAVTTIAARNPSAEFAILHDGIPAKSRRRIEGDASASIEWIPMQATALAPLSNSAFLPPAALFRLMLPHVLPHVRRTVYLDADIVCQQPLDDLYDIDLEGLPVAAVRDSLIPFAAGPLGTDWRELGLRPDSPYFNSGVLVMDLLAFRDGALSERATALLRGRSLRWGDQCALNATLTGLWQELDHRWNVQSADIDGRSLGWALWPKELEMAVRDAAIIHFTERDKPWHSGSTHPAKSAWFDALSATAWSSWKPAPQRLATIRRRALT